MGNSPVRDEVMALETEVEKEMNDPSRIGW